MRSSDAIPSLNALRSHILRSNLPELNLREIILPFLSIIQQEMWINIALLISLEAILQILNCWPSTAISSDPPSAASDTITEIVESIMQCKHHISDHEQAHKALILIIQILGKIAESSHTTNSLSDHAMWQLVVILYDLAQALGGTTPSSNTVSSLATKCLLDSLANLYQNPLIYYSTNSSRGFALPCAVKVMAFLIEKVNQPSLGQISRGELHLCLKLLYHILSVCDAKKFMQTPSLMLFINDDLCKMLLINGRLDARLGVKTCLLCLKIFRVIWTRMRWILKIQLEAILNGIFGRTLYWILSHLHRQATNSTTAYQVRPTTKVQSRIEEILGSDLQYLNGDLHEVEDSKSSLYFVSYEIAQCLVDLLADPSMLSDLFVNYDCDGAHCDVLQNLIELLALIVQQSHEACRASYNHRRVLWIKAIEELAIEALFNVVYALDRRNRPGVHTTVKTSTSLRDKKERKRCYQKGVQEFNRKPVDGIRCLQMYGFLPSPLEPLNMAMFLRSLPQGIDKKMVGIYLGAKGKELNIFEKECVHEADTVSFHQDVLKQYVASFDFDGECILDALRMFLASFRLPGEAQQIDRILNTFAYRVYQQCRDRFLMASPDVAYLLSFSLIMLNTDLHNPNILPEKKMSCQDFIRNNTNYGEEVSRAQDLPSEFLTYLYLAIATNEIQTMDECGIHGEILTEDRWKDLMKQMKTNQGRSKMIVHMSIYHEFLGPMMEAGKDEDPHVQGREPASEAFLSTHLRDGHYDHDIFEVIFEHMFNAFASIFDLYVDRINQIDTIAVTHHDRAAGTLRSTSISSEAFHEPEKKMLQMACNGLVSCSSLAGNLGCIDRLNALFLRLLKYTFLIPSPDCYRFSLYDFSDPRLEFCGNPSALLATAGVLRLVYTSGAAGLSLQAWRFFCHVLCALRDLQALPPTFYRQVSTKDKKTKGNTISWWMSDEELADFLARTTRILEWSKKQREQTTLTTQTSTSYTSFLGGVAWLFSAFESSPTEENPTNSTNLASAESDSHEPNVEADESISSAVESEQTVLSSDCERPTELANLECEAAADAAYSSGSAQWLQKTLQPYHLDTLLDHLVALPRSILHTIVEAMQTEILRGVTASNRSTTLAEDDHLPLLDFEKAVFLQRVLSALIVNASPRLIAETKSLDDEKRSTIAQLWPALESHVGQVVEALRPTLCQQTTALKMPYSLASTMLQRILERLIGSLAHLAIDLSEDSSGSLVVESSFTRHMDLILEITCKLLDMEMGFPEIKRGTGDSDSINRPHAVIEPFVAQLLRGFRFLTEAAKGADTSTCKATDIALCSKFSETVLEVSKIAVQQRLACHHAFSLVSYFLRRTKSDSIDSYLLAPDDVRDINLTEYFTILLQTALEPAKQNWISVNQTSGSMELPLVLETLEGIVTQYKETGKNEVDECTQMATLEQYLGGMLLIAEYHWEVEVANRDHYKAGEWVDAALRAFQLSVRAIHSQAFPAYAWINVLECGLLPFGTRILSSKCKRNASNPTITDRITKNGTPFFYFYELLGFKETQMVSSSRKDSVRRHSLSSAPALEYTEGSARTRRSCSILESSLDPMTTVVELITHIICAHLEKLVRVDSFPPIWDQIVEFLLQVLLYTRAPNGAEQNCSSKVSSFSPNSSVEVITKLIVERRDILTAHEMITEHIKCLLRKMSSDEDTESASSEFQDQMRRLIDVWEYKCTENDVYSQLLMDLFSIEENGAAESGESG
uniref:Uncharacterized protein AlNc14C36G3170 n=1 Tax=Albugo laibachii Nc14 TaxID=890382 RepID=F0W8P4_9STRA|nr:conserved hypothetical protein [Albugo laibachii Nc14]|eukprot:CCA17501.1 conserved hypothetical protein [Albugo laibachii Nc14]